MLHCVCMCLHVRGVHMLRTVQAACNLPSCDAIQFVFSNMQNLIHHTSDRSYLPASTLRLVLLFLSTQPLLLCLVLSSSLIFFSPSFSAMHPKHFAGEDYTTFPLLYLTCCQPLHPLHCNFLFLMQLRN